jgi:integrase
MSRALVRGRDARSRLPAPTLTIAAGRKHTIETILKAWLERKSKNTVRSYEQDLTEFALFVTRALAITPRLTVGGALQILFRQESPGAHEMVLAFAGYLQKAGLSTATVNRHLASLRSIAQLARQLGFCTFFLEVRGSPVERRRATWGPTVEQVKELLAATAGDTERETRSAAIVMVFFTMGLRVSELCGLNLEDTDLRRGSTWILGKGRKERELVPIPASTVAAIERYLVHRQGPARGPLFLTRSRYRGNRAKNHDGRLETRSVLRIVRELGQEIGIHLFCHGFRHAGISVATQQSTALGLSLDKVRAFSRHRGINTLLTYIDDREQGDNQRALSDLVASTLDPKGRA